MLSERPGAEEQGANDPSPSTSWEGNRCCGLFVCSGCVLRPCFNAKARGPCHDRGRHQRCAGATGG